MTLSVCIRWVTLDTEADDYWSLSPIGHCSARWQTYDSSCSTCWQACDRSCSTRSRAYGKENMWCCIKSQTILVVMARCLLHSGDHWDKITDGYILGMSPCEYMKKWSVIPCKNYAFICLFANCMWYNSVPHLMRWLDATGNLEARTRRNPSDEWSSLHHDGWFSRALAANTMFLSSLNNTCCQSYDGVNWLNVESSHWLCVVQLSEVWEGQMPASDTVAPGSHNLSMIHRSLFTSGWAALWEQLGQLVPHSRLTKPAR